MKKYYRLLTACLFVFFLSACDFATWVLGLETCVLFIDNRSDYNIDYYIADNTLHTNAYPDSLPMTNYALAVGVNSGQKKIVYENPLPTWKRFFKCLPHDTLSIFILHPDTIDLYTWDEIRDGYKILKRYDLSLEDLKRCDYTIVYPDNP